jgi:predicted DCC family thiol-disulfide oxidoreductase YuxK
MGAILLFDGVCNFCDASVNFIIARDRAGYFKFAPLQSETGQELTRKFGLEFAAMSDKETGRGEAIPIDSVILIENEKAYTHSTAALRVARKLDGIWSWGYAFIVLPRAIRDFFYKLFARHRYRLFGKKDVCMMPTPELKQRFLS